MIGVLAFQGSFSLHLRAFARLGVQARGIKRAEHVAGLTHLVIPGGESTVISQLLVSEGLFEPLRARLAGGDLACLGTCAGAILLGREPEPAPGEAPIGAGTSGFVPREPVRFEVCATAVRRNAYGRQIDSFRAPLDAGPDLCAAADPLEGVFIRAPRFEQVPDGAEILASHEGEPVLVREGRILLAAFHPELTDDLRVHRLLVSL